MAQLGTIRLVETREDLFRLLDLAIGAPEKFRATNDSTEVAASVQRFEELVEDLLRRPRRSRITHLFRGPRSMRAGERG